MWYQAQLFLPNSNTWISIGDSRSFADAIRDCWASQFNWVCDCGTPIELVRRMEWRIASIHGTNTMKYDPVPYDPDFTDWRKSDEQVIQLWKCAMQSAEHIFHEKQPA